jgi:hypothetical protein
MKILIRKIVMKDISILSSRWRDFPLVIHPSNLKFFFNGMIPNQGKGPIGFDVESIIVKSTKQTFPFVNSAGEIAMVSGFPDYDCFFHSFIYHNPEKVISYNERLNGLSKDKLQCSPPIEFVHNQIKRIFEMSNPIIVGYDIISSLKAMKFKYNNYYDIQSFFYEYTDDKTGFKPISLKRIVKKFFNIELDSKRNCIEYSIYAIKIYEEIILDWKNISEKFQLKNPPFNPNDFS